MSIIRHLALAVPLVACSEIQAPPSAVQSLASSRELALVCASLEPKTTAIVNISAEGGVFNISAKTESGELFQANGQRPALNVRVEDVVSEDVREFVDFNPKGLETIPVDGPNKLEIDLGKGDKTVTYADAAKQVQLACAFDSRRLVNFLGIAPVRRINSLGVKAVAFDIDDTLLFTSPTFARGFATGGLPKPDDVLFWTHTNDCDRGCGETTITLPDGSTKVLPANAPSTPKAKAIALIKHHQSLGHAVYAITARPDINGGRVSEYLAAEMGIARENVFFEPDMDQPGNRAGKTDRIESLNLDIFYGDSDSDITDARKAFVDAAGVRTKTVQAIRFLRSPKSSNRKAGQLNKYHPGYFGEPILSGSY